MRGLALGFALVIVCGCATRVTPIGPDRIMVSKQAATVFESPASLVSDTLVEANEHCAREGRVAVMENWMSVPDARGFPNVMMNARCVAPEQAQAYQDSMKYEPIIPGASRQSINVNVNTPAAAEK